jgi:hypothetical protein
MSGRQHGRPWSRRIAGSALAGALVLAGAGAACAQQQGQRPGQQQGQRPGPGQGQRPAPVLPYVANDTTGFVSIFDGTLKNWDGDPRFWRVEDGAIVGESTPEKQVNPNTFLIYRGERPGDFELMLEFRMNSTNSGVQIRSKEMPEVGKWVLAGYQADFDYTNRYTGQWYEERGRGFLALRGTATHVPSGGGKPQEIGSLGTPLEMKGVMNANGWNQLHLIARGNQLTQILNGRVTSIVVDDDAAGRSLSGLIGFQMHMGPPMKVEFRNVYLKRL